MSNTDQGKAKRQTVADRQWIDAAGAETTDETKATGFRYILLGDGADKAARIASGTSFVYQFPADSAGNPETMLAIFGGLTKAGNIVNTATHGDNPMSDPKDIIADVKAWFDDLDSGKWGEERVSGPGARFDRELLAKALHQVTGKPLDSFITKLAEGSPKIRINALNKQDPNGKREVLYGTFALYNTKVKEAYNKLAGTNEPSVADL
jgi:hypothetical protein